MSNFLKKTKRASEELSFDETVDTVGHCANCGVEFHIHKTDEINGTKPADSWQLKFYEFDTNLIVKPFAANTNDRIRWLEENYTLIPKPNSE